MRNLDELNIAERAGTVRRIPPDDATITSFEARWGCRLPDEYRRLLGYSNGGHPERNSILPHGARAGVSRWSINRFYHLDSDTTSSGSLWRAMEIWRPVLGQSALPFGADSGGNQFYLDLSVMPAAVKICLHDDKYRTLDIAPSFDMFLDALEEDPDAI